MAEAEKRLVPVLRFPGFEGDWEEKRLGALFIINAGGDICKEHVSQIKTEKYCFPIYANASENKGFYAYSDIYKIEPPAVTIAGRGVYIGIAHARDHKFYPIVRLLVLKPINRSNISFFESSINRLRIFNESTGVPQLTAPQISGYRVTYPTYIEQTKISSFLTAVDKRLSLLQKKKEALELYKKGVIQKIFSRELRFKDDRGENFPDWEEKRLGEVAEIVGGGTPDTTKSDYWNEGLQWFTPTEIKSKYLDSSLRKISLRGLEKSSAKLLPPGTILFTSRATIGDVGISQSECSTNQGFQSFIPNNTYNSEFLYYWILMNKKMFIRHSSGSTFLEISKKELQKLPIELPSFSEQNRIATFLSSLDKAIDFTKKNIESNTNWKKGLLQKMFV